MLSDISCQVSFDVARNQIARSIDVLLDRNPALETPLCNRSPEETLFVVQSPKIFKDNPHARLYGWLLEDYRQSPSALGCALPHRSNLDWASVASRIGWLTWEDCEATLPGSCRWLAREPSVSAPADIFEPPSIPTLMETVPYALDGSFDKGQLESLIAAFESAAKRGIDRSLSQKLRHELLETDAPRLEHHTMLQLAKWCDTNNPLYWDGMDVARKISKLLFGFVLDRHQLNI